MQASERASKKTKNGNCTSLVVLLTFNLALEKKFHSSWAGYAEKDFVKMCEIEISTKARNGPIRFT
jgi:hypothetical protein